MSYLNIIILFFTLFFGSVVSAQTHSAWLSVKSDNEAITYPFDSFEDLDENLDKILSDFEPITEKRKKEKPAEFQIEITVTKANVKGSTTVIKSVLTNQTELESDMINFKKQLVNLLSSL
ncbi:hypothetical protein [Flavobacterium sp.]|uniref:hypothetical protein n=1 Tax=Flavobacterium sp. TaxID=239 RepID=UPI002FDD568B